MLFFFTMLLSGLLCEASDGFCFALYGVNAHRQKQCIISREYVAIKSHLFALPVDYKISSP